MSMTKYRGTETQRISMAAPNFSVQPPQMLEEAEGRLYNYLYEAVDSFGQIQTTEAEIQSEVGEISQHQRDWMDKHTND